MKIIFTVLTLLAMTFSPANAKAFTENQLLATSTMQVQSNPSQGSTTVQKGTTDGSGSTSEEKIPDGAGLRFALQLLILLIVIYFGIKFGGIALGLLGGFGITIIVFAFGEAPGAPPLSVMLIILAVVTTSASLEATGALSLIVNYVEKLLKKNPKNITFLAPLSTFFLTALLGTGHASYSLYPIIYDVAYKNKIRPERPMAVSAIASQMGITASPIAAAAAAVIGTMAIYDINIGLADILRVTIPASLFGVLLASVYSFNRGKDLMKDPDFLKRYNDPKIRQYMEVDKETDNKSFSKKTAQTALILFVLGVLSVVIIAANKDAILPIDAATGKTIKLDIVLQFVMLAVGAIIIFVTKVNPKDVSNSKVFNAGMVATIMIFGIAWLSDTVIQNNMPFLLSLIKESVSQHPWSFAIAMFMVSMFLKSQAVVITVMFPIGLALGLPISVLIGSIPASYAYFFFCFYPTDLAAINFDRSGTTHVGKYILNHSMMLPGLIGTISATVLAYILANFVYTF